MDFFRISVVILGVPGAFLVFSLLRERLNKVVPLELGKYKAIAEAVVKQAEATTWMNTDRFLSKKESAIVSFRKVISGEGLNISFELMDTLLDEAIYNLTAKTEEENE